MNEPIEPELLEIFEAEATSFLSLLTELLVNFEFSATSDAGAELLRELFRHAHSFKGAAATVGREDLAEAVHGLESRLDNVRRGRELPSRALVDAALCAIDVLSLGIHTPLTPEQVASANAQLSAAPPVSPGVREEPQPALSPLDALMAALTSLAQSGPDPERWAKTLERVWTERTANSPGHDAVVMLLGQTVQALRPGQKVPTGLVEAGLLAVDLLQSIGTPVPLTDASVRAVLHALGDVQATARQSSAGNAAAAAPATPAPATAAPANSAPEATVRIPVTLLDSILYRLDELAALRLRLDHHRRSIEESQEALESAVMRVRARQTDPVAELDFQKRGLERLHQQLTQEGYQLGLLVQALQDDVKEVRLVPVRPLLTALGRTVRDLAHRLGKDALLEVGGDDVRLDKRLLELIKDPLTHLLRNAVDHGLETPEERQRAGKSPAGRIQLSAFARDSQVILEVRDDGRGISFERVRDTAIGRGILDAERASVLPEREILNLIFEPGFSTSSIVTEISGRGVGLDVVRENVAALGGRIEFFSTPGNGAEFRLSIPLTLATSRGLVVRAGTGTFCLPLNAVEEVFVVETASIGVAQGQLAIPWRHQAVTLVPLADLLEGRPSQRPNRAVHAVLLALSDRRLALGVEALEGQEEIVVKALAPGTPRLPLVAGVSSLADGRLVTVLEPSALFAAAAALRGLSDRRAEGTRAVILVVDDSLTSRTLMASVLERAGYQTLLAPDGAAALALLASRTVDLVLTDVEMPVLNGLGLVEQLRARPQTARLPVILLTSLGSAQDRARGAASGADAYLVKKEFEAAQLLTLVSALLARPS